jgi:hypothetical protein
MLRLYLAGSQGSAAGLLLLRVGLLVGLLAPATLRGPWDLLAASAGLLASRTLVLKRAAEEPWADRPSKPT